AELHDVYRYSKGGKPTFERVMAAVALLHQHQIRFNVLCVVNRLNARKPIDVYRFLRDQVRPYMIQFLSGVEPASFHNVAPGYWNPDELPISGSARAKPGQVDSVVAEWSVDPDDWGYFLCRVWDEWLKRDFGRVFVDQFENVISQMLGKGAQKCVSGQICGKALAIEHNGDVYSCDHFVYPEYKLGNIRDVHEGEMAFSERQQAFGYAKQNSLPKYCRECSYLNLCWGECPKNRFVKAPDGEAGLNYLCPGLKKFYAKVTQDRSVIVQKLTGASKPGAQHRRY
ncbi:MAG: SPASM domain-containing protein, partial [Burkholderiales bacterium]